jgi:hypothetical protein
MNHLLAPRRVSKVVMIWQNLCPVGSIGFETDEILWVVEHNLDDDIVICDIHWLGIK